MTSQDRAARNRANAKKSTGPKTAAGKATAAQNARRHGVTAKPDPASIAPWLRVILNDPDLTPADLLAEDDRMRRALALASAEVKVCVALASLDRFERGDEAPSDIGHEVQAYMDTMTNDLTEPGMTKRQFREGLSLLQRLERENSARTAPAGKRHRLLSRYLREAQSQRRRAFQAWLAFVGEETKEVREAA